MLQVGVSFLDLRTDSPELFRRKVEVLLRDTLENSGLEGLLVFASAAPVYTSRGVLVGATEEVELMKGGVDIEVTDENKVEYLNLLAEYLLQRRVSKGLDEFTKGFTEVSNVCRMFWLIAVEDVFVDCSFLLYSSYCLLYSFYEAIRFLSSCASV